ncbi:MAG: flagellar biosynthesis anti-sigma factor FlgM [Peptococcaceae bacterium]|nr:flagellar biosynthesis anti-sigma factor FlgM [Peptococcaceae bacterium]
MKIDRVSELVPLREDAPGIRKYTNQSAPANDNVEVSQLGRLSQEINVAVRNSDAVRAEKVASLKQAIDNNTYNVNAQTVATKLLQQRAD